MGVGLSYPILYYRNCVRYELFLPSLLVVSAQRAGGRQEVQGLDAELGGAWGARRTAKNRVRTQGSLGFPIAKPFP